MRVMTYIVVAVVALAIAVPAEALTFLQPFSGGPVTIKFRNWDTGVLYGVQDGTYSGAATLDALPQTPPPNSFGGEDMWGVLQMTEIYGSENNLLWSHAVPGTPEITGLIWGGTDVYLNQSTTAAGITQNIHATGINIAMWEDPNNDLGNPAGQYSGSANVGTARRTGVTTFEGATEGTLLWTATSMPGFDGNFPSDEFFTTFSPSGGVFAGGNNAEGGMWADLGPIAGLGEGAANALFEPTAAGEVDWRIAFTGKPDPTNQFLVLSDDPLDATMIPEPLTMAGMLLGIGGIARYVRKRRA